MGGLQAKSMTSQRNRAEPSQDGGYVLLWQRYDNNKMVAMRYYGNVMIFYIFNSTVIDWTCFFCIVSTDDESRILSLNGVGFFWITRAKGAGRV